MSFFFLSSVIEVQNICMGSQTSFHKIAGRKSVFSSLNMVSTFYLTPVLSFMPCISLIIGGILIIFIFWLLICYVETFCLFKDLCFSLPTAILYIFLCLYLYVASFSR